MQEQFSARLTRLMRENKITIRRAAEIAGVAPSTIQNWRTGTMPGSNYDAVRKLSVTLEVSLSYLLTGETDLPSRTQQPPINELFGYSRGVSEIFEVTIRRMLPLSSNGERKKP